MIKAWPKDAPNYYNGCAEPCDMWIGPCSCGATHLEGEFEYAGLQLWRYGMPTYVYFKDYQAKVDWKQEA